MSMQIFYTFSSIEQHQTITADTKKETSHNIFYRSMNEVGIAIKDFAWLHRNLLSVDSAKILTAFTPLYLITRAADDPVQQFFYDPLHHKNINQMPRKFSKGIEKTVSVIVFSGAGLALFVPDKRLRTTSRLFALGLFSGLVLKDVAKIAKTNANLRPWHEQFSSVQRSHGGFPSGHMFEMVFMTMTYGLEYGLKAWIPLGLCSTAMAIVSVTANRHYASQVVAGTALGVVYGMAAHKRVAAFLRADECTIDITTDKSGNPAISVTYNF